MKPTFGLFVAGLLLANAATALAAVRYVDVSNHNSMWPYTSWATAASGIQEAIEVAVAGDEIVVTNGTYSVGGRSTVSQPARTNRVSVDKPLALRSVNGPQSTIIDGGGVFRCVYLTNGASLSGFTLSNGVAADGGGLWCESTNAVASNCALGGNYARSAAGGRGGGAFGGTLTNCTLISNKAGDLNEESSHSKGSGGGAAYCTLNNCALNGNTAGDLGDGGGSSGCTLNNCTLSGNSAFDGGAAYGSTLNNCSLNGNRAARGGGAYSSTLNNCTLTANRASGYIQSFDFRGGVGGGAYACTLNNCTLSGNSALRYLFNDDGGRYGSGGGAESSTLNNCIVYYNTSTNEANYGSSCTLNYSCTTPLPTNGVGNITNEPAFVNLAAGNYRLRPDSPCIDAGTNLSGSITNDLDGRPRPLDGNGDGLAAFDMGAYEYRTPLLVWQDSPNPTPPHADWATAAHTIQDAVDAAVAGDEIVVTNGTYSVGGRSTVDQPTTTNRVVVDKPLALRSVNGPQSTIIDGGGVFRCVYLTNGASLSGFALTNGRAQFVGGGLWCASTDAMASNCLVSGNSSFVPGPTVIPFIPHCCSLPISGPIAGGVYGGMLNNCILSDNRAETYSFFGPSCDLSTCHTVSGPYSRYDFPGSGGGVYGCTLNNCTLTGNSAGGDGGGAVNSTLNNCTLTGNWAGEFGGGAYNSMLNNCIAYFNTAPQEPNYDSSSVLNYSCTTPLATNGVGNITNAPLFVDQTSGNLRLQSNSPCINAGFNGYAPAGSDLDGNPRIVGGTVDLGAYEYQDDLAAWPITLVNPVNLPGGAFQFAFIGAPNGTYAVLMKTDLTSRWTVLGPATEFAPGLFAFREQPAAASPQRFYAVVNEFWPIETRACPGAGPNPCPCNPDLYDCIISPNGGAWKKNVNGRCPCGDLF